MRYILVIDEGTTGTRAMIFDEKTEAVSFAQKICSIFSETRLGGARCGRNL